jgi:hypothetical protein
MAGGIAAIPASASSAGSSVTPDASWIAGSYWTLGSCELAGDQGVRNGDWKEFICVWGVKEETYYLNVTD